MCCSATPCATCAAGGTCPGEDHDHASDRPAASNPLLGAARLGVGAKPAGIAIPTRTAFAKLPADASVSGDSSRAKAQYGACGPQLDSMLARASTYRAGPPSAWHAQQALIADRAMKAAGAAGDPSTSFPYIPVALGFAAGAIFYMTVMQKKR